MRRLIPAWGIIPLLLLFAATVAAQYRATLSGQVLDKDGKPYAGVTVQVKSEETGQTFPLKADKDGHFVQILPRGGTYDVTILDPQNGVNYTEPHPISNNQDTSITINLKQVAAQAASNPEDKKKQDEAASNFNNMKVHFEAGTAAMGDASQIRKQLSGASADQKSALQDKLSSDNQTAVTEFQQAEQAAGSKDVKNHALIWANLGQAYDSVGKFDDSMNAYQKAIDLQPAPSYYVSLSLDTAKVGTAQNDPAVLQQKVTDASNACDKAAGLDPTTAAGCWKNLGIVLSNKGALKDAIPPFQKATQANPKDAQSWYLLGGAYTGTIETKQEGDKLVYNVPPEAGQAYQKCIDADPNGPYAAQAKTALDGLAALSGGAQTTVGQKSPSKKK